MLGQVLIEITREGLNDCITFVSGHFDVALKHISGIVLAVLENAGEIEVTDIHAGKYIKVAVIFTRDGLDKITKIYNSVKEYIELIPIRVGDEFETDVRQFLNDLANYLRKFKSMNSVLTFYMKYQSWFEEFHLSRRIEEVTTDFRSHLLDIGRQLAKLKATISHYWSKTIGLIQRTISDYPLLAYGVSVGKKVVKVAKTLLEDMSAESSLRLWLRRLVGRADAVASTLVRLIDVVYHRQDLMSYDFSFDFDQGSVLYAQVLPFQWYSFQDTPDAFKVAELAGVGVTPESEAAEALDWRTLQHDLLEVINAISSALQSQAVIPPFSATALVAGDAHIITFDQTYYNFAGAQGCSYLLTSDFSHNRFSAVANYDADMRRTSIDVVSDGHTINIDTTPVKGDPELIKVTMDKRNVQLPLRFDHTYVYRQESSIIVENSEGLRASCNTAYNVCTFTISGWYFGKTGGLLGIYDNEPSNDWMTSERQIVSTLEAFVTSWSVTKDKRCPVRFFGRTPQNSQQETEVCEAVFASSDESSALMPCFSTVDPKPYMSMCKRDMQTMKNRADKRTGICSAAAAYIEQCRQAGVELWMPAQCVLCQPREGEIMQNGESSRIQGNGPQSADVVFVVEQSTCLNQESLHDLPYLVDRSLRSNGLAKNRFALVGFGGSDQLQKPHIFTAGSRIFNSVGHMSMAFNNLKPDGDQGDVFEALQFAARLRFRPGVAKSFLLVRCESSESLTSRAYGDSMTMLVEQGIVLHLMTPLELRLKAFSSPAKMTSKMYGFTKEAVITPSRLDSALRRQLKDPKDHLSTLAQESGGSVFDLGRLQSGDIG